MPVIALLIPIAAFATTGKGQVAPVQLEMSEVTPIQIGSPVTPPPTCQVGNLNSPAWAIGDFIIPPEEYLQVFMPSATCPNCQAGVDVNSISIVLQTDAAASLQMNVFLSTAVFPDSPTCPVPGSTFCTGPLNQVDIPGAGIYSITLPIDCSCLDQSGTYLLGIHFESASVTGGGVPDLVSDTYPVACASWNIFSASIFDLVTDFGFPGQIAIYADAECCEGTGTEKSSWGKIKELYRD